MSVKMKTFEAKLIHIGNSKGLRLPKKMITKYHLNDNLLIEEKEDGILIKNNISQNKLSWEETYKAMSKENENWNDFDSTISDGINEE